MISGTITDLSGRTLSGQTPSAFWSSIRHSKPFTVGLNCALGADAMRPHLQELSGVADTFISAYPNAGLPNSFGGYDESPDDMARQIEGFAAEGLVNVVGGCCGSTPEHIRAIAEAVAPHKPREVPEHRPFMSLAGLEPFEFTKDVPFVNVGERTNVTGSAKFRKLITAGDFTAALAIARDQVENGASVIDINMDEGLIDSQRAMVEFVNLIAAEPDIARVPIMLDSSKFEIMEAGLKCVQGKPVVNSISMKEGEEKFIAQAKLLRNYGAAVVVMAFDEQGQADTYERKVAICERAYKLLTEEADFPPEDIIFDPNIFAVATGIEEHNSYGLAFIQATKTIRERMPLVHISGGVSNLSFSFRGNEPVREAMHAVFLYHAIQAGMDMGIVNAGQLAIYENIDPDLREACEDVVLNRPRRRDRTDARYRRTLSWNRGQGSQGERPRLARMAGGEAPFACARQRHQRVHRGRYRGGAPECGAASACDRGPADGRHERGRRPVRLGQDVPAAGGEIRPRDEAGRRRTSALYGREKRLNGGDQKKSAGKVLMATVKGDVHDIGKNIVGVVLACNNYEIIDLGVWCRRPRSWKRRLPKRSISSGFPA
jgi:5-methyltetrahydrofolate--homocysteine methyltransferase